jgi:hypothetical protein
MSVVAMNGMPREAVSDHLVPLRDQRWGLWRWGCLRGAGFPAAMVSDLSSPACVAGADRLLLLQRDIEHSRAEALAFLRRDLQAPLDVQQRRRLGDAITCLKQARPAGPLGSTADAALEQFKALTASRSLAEKTYRQEFMTGLSDVSAQIRRILRTSEFRHAILLQNRAGLALGMDSLTDDPPDQLTRSKKQRQREGLVAKYLQRYCMKNDSIGFFGPVGWFRFNRAVPHLAVVPGPGLIRKSNIYFEQWCIEAVAEALEQPDSLRDWMRPRCLPAFYLEGSRLHLPGGASIVLSPFQRAILSMCTGELTASRIAEEVLQLSIESMHSKSDVYAVLQDFERRGMIAWKFEISWDANPERKLRSLLEQISLRDHRESALAVLEELKQAKDDVTAAFGDVARFEAQLERLEQTFSRLTGKNTTRNAGRMYAGRTLVYQDCRRDLDMEVGSEIIEELSPALTLILTSARWYTCKLATAVRKKCWEIYRATVDRTRRHYTEVIPFWLQLQNLLDPGSGQFNFTGDLQSRWQNILGEMPAEQREVRYASQDIRDSVAETFAAPDCGWQAARQHSPDVMIAAADTNAIRRGDYLLVLGELHMALNTLRLQCFMSQHPNVEEMQRAIESDWPVPGVVVVAPRSWPQATARTLFSLVPGNHYHLEASHDSMSSAPRSKTLPISAFVVEDSAEGLVVRTRDNRLRFEVVEFFADMLSWHAADQLKIIPLRSHTPRVVIDRLVVLRESWSYRAEEIGFVHKGDEADRFLEARRWAQEQQLPRHVFVKTQVELKPLYFDLESPIFVEVLAKLVRSVLASRAPAPIVVSEMLPGPDQLWLPDITDRRYCCELRIVAVDRLGMGQDG